jgi:hypothetical protein
MYALRISFEQGHISRDSMDSTLIAYYNSCAEMRSEARDAKIHKVLETGTLEMVCVDFPFTSRNYVKTRRWPGPLQLPRYSPQ